MPHPDAVFGSNGITMDVIADQIRQAKPSALSHDQREDFITLLEYLREQAIVRHDQTETRMKMVKDREDALAQAEKLLEQRMRVVEVVLKGRKGWRSYLWR